MAPMYTRAGATLSPGRVLVVVPAFNEAATVASVIEEVRRLGANYDLLVVDDGSVDGTAAIARLAGARVAVLPVNLGVGAAMRVGFRYALDHGYDAVVQVDADAQHDAEGIPRLLDLLSQHDVVVGTRFSQGVSGFSTVWYRRCAMRFLAWLCSVVTGTELTDVTSGFRAHGRRAIALYARHYPAEYLGDTVESLIMASRAGLDITETAISMRARRGGRASQTVLGSVWHVTRAVALVMMGLTRSVRAEGEFSR